MKALADIMVLPIGTGVSVREEVKRAHAILEEAGINAQLHPNGTNVEGEIADVFAAIQRVHETLHAEGIARLVTIIKLGTRVDKDATLASKMFK
jgi:uncharacterized protein (TIGR00106 family)